MKIFRGCYSINSLGCEGRNYAERRRRAVGGGQGRNFAVFPFSTFLTLSIFILVSYFPNRALCLEDDTSNEGIRIVVPDSGLDGYGRGKRANEAFSPSIFYRGSPGDFYLTRRERDHYFRSVKRSESSPKASLPALDSSEGAEPEETEINGRLEDEAFLIPEEGVELGTAKDLAEEDEDTKRPRLRTYKKNKNLFKPQRSQEGKDNRNYNNIFRRLQKSEPEHHYFRSLRSSQLSVPEPYFRSLRSPLESGPDHYFRSLRSSSKLRNQFRSLRSSEEPDHYFRSLRSEPDHYFRSLRSEPDHYFRSLRSEPDHYFRSLRSVSDAPDHYFRSLRSDPDHYFRSLRSSSDGPDHYFRSLRSSFQNNNLHSSLSQDNTGRYMHYFHKSPSRSKRSPLPQISSNFFDLFDFPAGVTEGQRPTRSSSNHYFRSLRSMPQNGNTNLRSKLKQFRRQMINGVNVNGVNKQNAKGEKIQTLSWRTSWPKLYVRTARDIGRDHYFRSQ